MTITKADLGSLIQMYLTVLRKPEDGLDKQLVKAVEVLKSTLEKEGENLQSKGLIY